jgi:hypothetical protein
MKFAKYVLTLVFAFCAFTSITKAQANVAFLGGGSSALFQELGAASQQVPGISCLWSFGTVTNPSGSPYIAANDGRTGVNLDENGKIFIAWGPGTGTCAAPAGAFDIYAYIQLDSVVGDRCYFENDGSGKSGCTLKLQNTTGVNGTSQITTTPDNPAASPLPTAVVNALTANPHFFVAGTDIRPEDAVFATQRALAPCNQLILRQFFNNTSYAVSGLGYQSASNPNVGVQILGDSAYGGGSFNVVNFNITGNDPITNGAVPSYSTSTIGAQPIIISAAPTTDGDVQKMADITSFTLSQYYAGNLGRTTDLLGPTVGEPMNFLVREGLSGTYNTFEYSIPQSTQFHTGQDTGNCNSSGTVLQNPMHLATAPGVFGGNVNRIRVIGTGNMVKFLNLAPNGTPVLGYWFWSAGNAKGLTVTKYLKVNGIDPLQDQNAAGYTYTGIIPGSTATNDPGLSVVNFAGLNAGNYPIWSALRLVGPPGNAGVSNMLTALDKLTVLQNDYIKPSNMKIWHSHFQINGQPANAANGPTVGTTTLCAGGAAEGGGDAGGSTMLIVNNANFCHDTGSTVGKLNLTF